MNLNIENNLDKKEINTEITVEKQNNFLQTTLGKTINTAVDVGLRIALPNVIEDEVIAIKNTLLNNGLKEGINAAIKSAIDVGKSAMGILTGKFENLSQINTAIKRGGLIDGISNTIDNVVKSASKNKLISKSTSNLIKKGKNAILDTIENSLEEKYLDDVNSLEKVSKYMNNWKNCYNCKDLEGMEREYKKIKGELDTIVALEGTISQAKKIENLHTFIKNKGIDYKLSEEEKELMGVL